MGAAWPNAWQQERISHACAGGYKNTHKLCSRPTRTRQDCMSALESIINQRLKEFESSKPDLQELKRKLNALQDEEAAARSRCGCGSCQSGDSGTAGAAAPCPAAARTQAEIRAVKEQISRQSEPSQEELDYLLQVGYLLYKMENGEEEFANAGEKSFYGCSVKVEKQKGLAYKRYMAEIENDAEYQDKLMQESYVANRHETCTSCGGDLVTNRECTYCRACGTVQDALIIDTSDLKNSITYEQQINDIVMVYSYNRLNHLNEWLSKLQAREMTNIPSDVLDALRLELKKARITNPKEITQKKVKELLKKLKLSKYYEHVPNITNMLTGAEVPKFPPHLEDKLRTMFEQVQEPFRLYCPKNRKNFLHYGYVLYKFCELLGEDRWLSYIPMLKSFDKLYVQDQIWKQICAHLRWEFIPSV
jgi:Poxvirus Late Transcription Factor VLTF3 like